MFIKKTNPLYLKGICHRGLHNNQFFENGLNAFNNAINNNLAFEFDIHLTKDNEIVVCHDSNLKRVTGKAGIIEELNLKDIKDNYRLLNGEEIPTLKEVLALCHERVPIVCEIKTYKNNYYRIAKKTKELLSTIKDKKNIVVISFDFRTLLFFKGYIRELLICEKKEFLFFFRGFFEGLDLDVKLVKKQKYQKYAKKHFLNVWTVKDENTYDFCSKYADTVTFELLDKEYVIRNQEKKYNKKFE